MIKYMSTIKCKKWHSLQTFFSDEWKIHWCIQCFHWNRRSFIGVFSLSYEWIDHPLVYPTFPIKFLIIHWSFQPFLLIYGSSIRCWCNESSESQPFIDSTKGPSVLLLSVCHQERRFVHVYIAGRCRGIFLIPLFVNQVIILTFSCTVLFVVCL